MLIHLFSPLPVVSFTTGCVTIGDGFGGQEQQCISTPGQIAFDLFCPIWSLLALTYIVLSTRFLERFAHPFALFGVDLLTTIFWFAGAIAAAAAIGAANIRNSPYNTAQAAVAFSFFSW